MFGSQASGKWHLRQLLRSSPEPPFYAGEDTPEAGRADTPTPVTRRGAAPRQRSVEEVGFRGPLRLGCRWRDRRCPRRQAETFEDRPGGVGRMDRGEDSHGPVADRALQDIHGEHPPHELGPAVVARAWTPPTGRRTAHLGMRDHPSRDLPGAATVRIRGLEVRALRHDLRSEGGTRRSAPEISWRCSRHVGP